MAKNEVMDEAIYFSNPKVYKTKMILKNILLYTLLVLQAVIILIPFYIMILTSLKDGYDIVNAVKFQWWVPLKEGIAQATKNYTSAFNEINFGKSVGNTLLVAFIGTAGTTVTTILAAYAFARLNFKGRDLLFSLFLATMMVPGEMFILTNYVTVGKFGWLGNAVTQTYGKALLCETVPFMTSIFYTYYLRQTFKQVPNELYYAAKVDGTSDLKYLFKVMVPVASGTIISIIILNAMSSWNAYIWPTLVTNNPNYRLVTAALRNANFSLGENGTMTDLARQMSAAVMVTVPLIIVFFALKKHIMRGVSRSGIKG